MVAGALIRMIDSTHLLYDMTKCFIKFYFHSTYSAKISWKFLQWFERKWFVKF